MLSPTESPPTSPEATAGAGAQMQKDSTKSSDSIAESDLPPEPVSPQHVVPITPTSSVPPYAFDDVASRASFDHNDSKYHCCCDYLHITLAARVVSVAYLCGAVLNVVVAVCLQGATLAFYSIASFAFALAIFGTLIYGVFKEKRAFILPYMIFQITSIICTACITFIFIVGTTFSNKMLHRLAADLGGVQINHNKNVDSDMQMFSLLFVIALVTLLFIQIWFLDIIYRFKEFIKDRENSFSLNLDSVLNDSDAIFGDFAPDDFEKMK